MSQALSTARVHNHRSHVVGYWDSSVTKCCVVQPRGPHFKSLGKADRQGRVWLLPEEMLYLIERGNLDVRWGMPPQRSLRMQTRAGGAGHKARDCGSSPGKGASDDVPGSVQEDEKREEEAGEDSSSGEDDDDDDDDDAAWHTLPMSLQGAYAVCVGDERDGRISAERWAVYAHLKRIGYAVLRAPSWTDEEKEQDGGGENPSSFTSSSSAHGHQRHLALHGNGVFGLFRRLFATLFQGPSSPSAAWSSSSPSKADEKRLLLGPLVRPGIYRSFYDIYEMLALIPVHDPMLASDSSSPSSSSIIRNSILPSITSSSESSSSPTSHKRPSTMPPFRIAFHVYKPRPTFRKSNPGKPDFRIAVINARETGMPTHEELSALLDAVPYEPPPPPPPRRPPSTPPPPSSALTTPPPPPSSVSAPPPQTQATPPHAAAPQHDQQQLMAYHNPNQIYRRLKHGYKHVILAVVDQGVTSYLRLSDAGFSRELLYGRYANPPPGGPGGRDGRGGVGGGRGGGARGRGGKRGGSARGRGGRGRGGGSGAGERGGRGGAAS